MSKKIFKNPSFRRKLFIIIIILIILLGTVTGIVYFNLDKVPGEGKIETEISYIFSDNIIQIPVTINGIPTHGIFDTGSSFCLLDEKSLDKFNVKVIPFFRSKINKTGSYRWGIIKNLEINNFKINNLLVNLMDFKTDSSIFKCIPSEIILGMNLIKKANWKFNFTKHSLKIYPKNYRITDFKAENFISFFYRMNLPFTYITINEKSHKVMVDFGCSGALMLAEDDYSGNKAIPYSNYQSYNIFGSYKNEGKALIDDFIFGNDTIPGVEINFTSPRFSLVGIETFLKYSEVLINNAEKKIYLSGMKKSAGTKTVFFGHGFYVYQDGGKIKISSIYKNSPAYHAGLNIGDTVLSINGIESSVLIPMDLCDFTELCKRFFYQDTVRVTVIKNGEILTKEIVKSEF